MNLREELDAGRLIEVMQKVHQQDEIVTISELNCEGVARQHLVAIGDSGGSGIFLRNVEYFRPILRDDLSLRKSFRHLDSEKPVAGGDIEDPKRGLGTVACDLLGDENTRGLHDGGHGFRERGPLIVFRRYATAVAQLRGASPDGFG